LLKFLVKHKIFFVFRFRLPKGSPAPHFFTASGGKNFLSSRKIFRPAQAPLRLSSSDNAKVRIFHHPCKHFAQKQHFFHPISLPILQEIKMRRNESQKRLSNTQFWTFGRGRLDVKAFSKNQRRKQYLYIIYILYISIKYINN